MGKTDFSPQRFFECARVLRGGSAGMAEAVGIAARAFEAVLRDGAAFDAEAATVEFDLEQTSYN